MDLCLAYTHLQIFLTVFGWLLIVDKRGYVEPCQLALLVQKVEFSERLKEARACGVAARDDCHAQFHSMICILW